MSSDFQLLMISAMYENGGNTTQRLLDGHPELQSYPYESQPGTKFVVDHFSSLYPLKYRWPVFPVHGTPASDYETIIDEECKVRIKTPKVSKFRHRDIDMDDKDRKRLFVEVMEGRERTRANLVEAYYRSSGMAWKDYARSGKEKVHVGYSPIIVIDALQILADYDDSHVLQVVRNPWSAYGDTKKRAVPLSIQHYMNGWVINQMHALQAQKHYPDRMHIVRFEDIVQGPKEALGPMLEKIGVDPSSDTLLEPTWNGQELEEVYPWGTIRTPTEEVNKATAAELSQEETDLIRTWVEPILPSLGY